MLALIGPFFALENSRCGTVSLRKLVELPGISRDGGVAVDSQKLLKIFFAEPWLENE